MNSLFRRLLQSFSYRIEMILLALFALDRNLPTSYKDEALHPKIIGSSSIFQLLMKQKPGESHPKKSIQKLSRRGKINPLSIESDVAKFLYDLTKYSKAKTIIEVGIYRGAGSLHFAQAIKENGGGELHLIDISQKYLSNVKKLIFKETLKVKVKTYLGESATVAKSSKLPLADIVFIDADHTYKAVKNDFALYWPKLKPQGYLVLHDTIMWSGPRNVANELSDDSYPVVTIATSGGSGLSVIKKPKTWILT